MSLQGAITLMKKGQQIPGGVFVQWRLLAENCFEKMGWQIAKYVFTRATKFIRAVIYTVFSVEVCFSMIPFLY